MRVPEPRPQALRLDDAEPDRLILHRMDHVARMLEQPEHAPVRHAQLARMQLLDPRGTRQILLTNQFGPTFAPDPLAKRFQTLTPGSQTEQHRLPTRHPREETGEMRGVGRHPAGAHVKCDLRSDNAMTHETH